MKKFILGLFLLCASIFSCTFSNVDNTEAIVRVSLPSASSRDISLVTAQNLTDTYQVVFRRSTDEKYHETVSATSSYIEMQIPAGTYDVVLLAGKTENQYTTALLASGYLSNVDIISNQVNNITLTLRSIDITFSTPSNVECGTEFSVSSTLDIKNPFITHAAALFRWSTEEPSDYSSSSSGILIAPVIPCSGFVSVGYEPVWIFDTYHHNWKITNSVLTPEIIDEYRKPIVFFESTPPVVGIIIEWGDD